MRKYAPEIIVMACIAVVVYFCLRVRPQDPDAALVKENDSLRAANNRLLYKVDSVLANIDTRDPDELRLIHDTIYIVKYHESNRSTLRALPFDSILRQQSVQLQDSI